MTDNSYLIVENISFENILEAVSLRAIKGDIISVVGESGSGKTSLLKCIAGFQNIKKGFIKLNNKILTDSKTFIKPNKRDIGFVFQNSPIFPHLSLKDNIILNLSKKYLSNYEKIIKITNLNKIDNKFSHQVSGGELQRASIATSLIREPNLLLLDEPFSNLDHFFKLKLINDIHLIIKNLNLTTILVTHDISDALSISNKILILKDGKVEQFDSPKNIYFNPKSFYVASISGRLNKIDKNKYIRPEDIVKVPKSDYKVSILNSVFYGKEYLVTSLFKENIWYFYNKVPLENNENVFLDFDSVKILNLTN